MYRSGGEAGCEEIPPWEVLEDAEVEVATGSIDSMVPREAEASLLAGGALAALSARKRSS